MISSALLALVRCPDCGRPLDDVAGELACPGCGRQYEKSGRDYLDLRPTATFEETTRYLDELMHADGRYRTVSPPLLMAGIRNDMLRLFLSIGPGDRVIDLGCGSGRMLVWNHGPTFHLVGVDVSPYFAAETRERIDLIVGDLRRLPLEDGAFHEGVFTRCVGTLVAGRSRTDALRGESCAGAGRELLRVLVA